VEAFMNARIQVSAIAMMLAGIVAIPVSAHHSFAMYDQTKTVTLTGVVKQFVPQANHAEIHIILLSPDHKALAKGADGKSSASRSTRCATAATSGRGSARWPGAPSIRRRTSRNCPPPGRTAIRSRATRSSAARTSDRSIVTDFALWLAATPPSVFLQEHNTWAIPAIQSVHIAGIAMVMGSVLMLVLRILGWTWADQTLRQTTARFGPWLTGSLWLLLITGVLLVVGEPVRELVSFSFWLKMTLVAIGALVAAIFQRNLRRHESHWESTLVHRASTKALAVGTFLIWTAIIVLGRLIAYDHVWGSWSPAVGQ
jgi:hypothetical protein